MRQHGATDHSRNTAIAEYRSFRGEIPHRADTEQDAGSLQWIQWIQWAHTLKGTNGPGLQDGRPPRPLASHKNGRLRTRYEPERTERTANHRGTKEASHHEILADPFVRLSREAAALRRLALLVQVAWAGGNISNANAQL